MSRAEWRSKWNRVLTNGEIQKLSEEIDQLSDGMDVADNDTWINFVVERLEEIETIIEDSLKTQRRSHLNLIKST